jgi:HPt (histidine-containing phosphotransfer) domain-containing protein
MFVKNNQNKFAEITRALEENNVKLAHRLVHTLKGNAGQIGKVNLQNVAAEVEHQLKDEVNNTTEENLKMLEDELALVLRELAV